MISLHLVCAVLEYSASGRLPLLTLQILAQMSLKRGRPDHLSKSSAPQPFSNHSLFSSFFLIAYVTI